MQIKRILKFLTLIAGASLVGILMLPTGALVMLISGVWKIADKMVGWLEDKKI